LFGDLDFKKEYGLGAVNSINWARIMFQITYYFWTYFRLYPNCDGTMSFSVPTGNFGDVLAGYYAKRMGLPVKHLVVATNDNDILHRFFTSGTYEKYPVHQTCSPSMDIGISSNFERYLFYLLGESPEKLSEAMASFKTTGKLSVNQQELARARSDFLSGCAPEADVVNAIRTYDRNHGYVLDPHTACGVSAVDQLRNTSQWHKVQSHTMVVLGTAHPAKFREAVDSAIGRHVTLPPGLARVEHAQTRFDVLDNSTQLVREAVVDIVRRREADQGKRPACNTCISGVRKLLLNGRP
jgi:threonine synthase